MKKLLIIDDDHDLFNLLSRLLTPDGFVCIHAPDGASGLDFLQRDAFDLVILDIMLPGMDGMEVLRRIRADETLPVLMLTARGEESDLVAGLEAGADDYLAKPFRSKELSARINTLLRRAARSDSRMLEDTHLDDLVINRRELAIVVRSEKLRVSMLEIRLLDLLTAEPGAVAQRQSLYQNLFGRSPYMGDRSLEMLVSRLRKKLGPRPDGGERIKAVRGEGYLFLRTGKE